MVTPILIDILIVAALVFFAWRGERRGFILTLCSLVAVIVAFAGATIITNAAAPKVAEYIQPRLEQSIQQSLEEKAQEVSAQDSLGVAEAMAALREKGGVYEWAADGLEELLKSSLADDLTQQAATAAAGVAAQLARSILFPVVFFLLLIAWAVLSHALDLVSKLPVVNSLNHGLGGLLGLVKGLLVVYVAIWVLCGPAGAISPQMVEETHLLRWLNQYSPLDLLKLPGM